MLLIGNLNIELGEDLRFPFGAGLPFLSALLVLIILDVWVMHPNRDLHTRHLSTEDQKARMLEGQIKAIRALEQH